MSKYKCKNRELTEIDKKNTQTVKIHTTTTNLMEPEKVSNTLKTLTK